jgi:mycothiol synthase
MLHIRRFVKGTDEPVWVDVLNAASNDDEFWRAITVDEFLLEQERPGFDFDGRFIAELKGRPAGIVHAYVDKARTDGQGFIRLGVIPEFRGREVERQLIETALKELRARGMTTAQSGAESAREDLVRLFERLGFERVRVFSLMEMDLAEVPRDVGENKEVTIRRLRLDVDEDIRLFHRLHNEAFSDHFNFRPHTLEETRHRLLNNPYVKQWESFFAVLNGEAVGYVGVAIDETYNLQRNTSSGWVTVIGVLKPHRREGVGASLMLHAIKDLKAKGISRALLGVDDYNTTRAIGVYEKVGFAVKRKDLVYQRSL